MKSLLEMVKPIFSSRMRLLETLRKRKWLRHPQTAGRECWQQGTDQKRIYSLTEKNKDSLGSYAVLVQIKSSKECFGRWMICTALASVKL
jgi:hypothetical protein